MQLTELICAAMVSALGLFLMVGGYILQRQKYWKRVWENLGEPQVESIKELKSLNRKQDQATDLVGVATYGFRRRNA